MHLLLRFNHALTLLLSSLVIALLNERCTLGLLEYQYLCNVVVDFLLSRSRELISLLSFHAGKFFTQRMRLCILLLLDKLLEDILVLKTLC
jgi:hypothetical protein